MPSCKTVLYFKQDLPVVVVLVLSEWNKVYGETCADFLVWEYERENDLLNTCNNIFSKASFWQSIKNAGYEN